MNAYQRNDQLIELSIFHTNDMHARLEAMARLSSFAAGCGPKRDLRDVTPSSGTPAMPLTAAYAFAASPKALPSRQS